MLLEQERRYYIGLRVTGINYQPDYYLLGPTGQFVPVPYSAQRSTPIELLAHLHRAETFTREQDAENKLTAIVQFMPAVLQTLCLGKIASKDTVMHRGATLYIGCATLHEAPMKAEFPELTIHDL